MNQVESAAQDLRAPMCNQLERQLAAAVAALASDPSASPVTSAVVAEFERKFIKTREPIQGSDPVASREGIVELEQAADSAKWAATADTQAAESTRQAIITAHDTICWFKSTGELLPADPGA